MASGEMEYDYDERQKRTAPDPPGTVEEIGQYRVQIVGQ